MKIRTILFLCTGNYYRSRFAEELFNHRAGFAGLAWPARSRALAIERGIHNVGPISPFALAALQDRGVSAGGAGRLPQQCAAADLEAADRIIGLNDPEHRPLMRERFPQWAARTEYWNVADVEFVSPHIALAAIEADIETLMRRLREGESREKA